MYGTKGQHCGFVKVSQHRLLGLACSLSMQSQEKTQDFSHRCGTTETLVQDNTLCI